MKARDFDEAFESGTDIMDYLDLANARRPESGLSPHIRTANSAIE